jgi:ABC-type multidrug transport system ATPase subunit
MVGRTVLLRVDKDEARPGEPVLEVAGVAAEDDRGHRVVDGVDLTVRAGEVLGIAGVQGNGQTELVEAIMGLRPLLTGTVTLQGRPMHGVSTRAILHSGVGYVPEDRSVDGLIKDFTVGENLVLDLYNTEPYGTRWVIRPDAIEQSARERIEQFDIRTPSPGLTVGTLSGGNQQKVIVAREFSRPLKLFVAAQPTRGVDVGSIEFIHRQIIHERGIGTAVLVVSSELDEVLALADRIAVMYRGRIIAEVPPDTPREEIGLLMAGITEGTPAERSAGPRHAAADDDGGTPAPAPGAGPRHAADDPENGDTPRHSPGDADQPASPGLTDPAAAAAGAGGGAVAGAVAAAGPRRTTEPAADPTAAPPDGGEAPPTDPTGDRATGAGTDAESAPGDSPSTVAEADSGVDPIAGRSADPAAEPPAAPPAAAATVAEAEAARAGTDAVPAEPSDAALPTTLEEAAAGPASPTFQEGGATDAPEGPPSWKEGERAQDEDHDDDPRAEDKR